MRKLFITFFFIAMTFFLFSPTTHAHELYIQVDEFEDAGELRVDVLWGHIRDYVSEANIDDLELYVKDPNGEIDILPLEEVGVHYRAYVPITDEGTYTFWVTREKSPYTPEDDVTQLSNHMGKVVHHIGSSPSNADGAIDMELEIVPDVDISEFSTGEFSGTVLLHGETISNATVTAYGPDHEVLEETTDADGNFQFTFASNGDWLIKANVVEDESGTIQGEDYEVINNTTTLLLDTSAETQAEEDQNNESNIWTYIALLVTGLLIGAAIPLFIFKKR